ncbi:acetyltransferase [Salinisphaera sp. S4-8]
MRILASNSSCVRVGSGARIGMYSVLNGGDSIDVGTGALLSGFVYLQTSQHRFDDRARLIRDQGYRHAKVVVGDGAWLAAHVVVMPGVSIGCGAVVGSNAVVTKSVAPREIVGGVPAQLLRNAGI